MGKGVLPLSPEATDGSGEFSKCLPFRIYTFTVPNRGEIEAVGAGEALGMRTVHLQFLKWT